MLLLLAAVVVGAVVGSGLGIIARTVTERRAVAAVAREWGADQRTVEPLAPGTRPVLLKDEGDMATVCELSGWPADPCARQGLSPRVEYGTPPRLEHVYSNGDGYAAVLSYIDATDQVSARWVVVDLSQKPDRSWLVWTFAEVPLSTEPNRDQVRGILLSTQRCDPAVYLQDGC